MNESNDHWYWGNQLIACLDAAQEEIAQHDPPVVDREIMPPFSGSSSDISVWFLCEKADEVERLKATEDALKRKIQAQMELRGFPALAITSLRVASTSIEDIKAGGGKFYYFR